MFAHVFLTSCDRLWLLLLLAPLELKGPFQKEMLIFQSHHSLRAYCGPSPPPQVPPSPDLRHLAHPKSRKHHRASVLPRLFLNSITVFGHNKCTGNCCKSTRVWKENNFRDMFVVVPQASLFYFLWGRLNLLKIYKSGQIQPISSV